MKTSRLIAGLTTGAMLSLTPLALAAPAQATETFQPQAAIEVSLPYEHQASGRIPVGETVNVTFGLRYLDSTGAERSVYKGAASLQMYTAKSGTWVDLGPASSLGYASYRDIKPDSNAAFRVVYTGYNATSQYEDNYLPLTSEAVPVAVSHKFKTNVGKNKSKKGTVIKGKVTPDYKKKKFTIFWKKKENAEFKKLRKVKTNKKGKFKVKLPAPKKVGPKYSFQFVTKGNDTYSASAIGITTSRGFFRVAGD